MRPPGFSWRLHRFLVPEALIEVTLTTFRDVAWNAPFYARLGFMAFEPGPERPMLQAIILEESMAGFGRMPRLAMLKRIADPL